MPWARVEGSAKRGNGPSSGRFNRQAGIDRGSCRALMLMTGTAMKCGANRTLKDWVRQVQFEFVHNVRVRSKELERRFPTNCRRRTRSGVLPQPIAAPEGSEINHGIHRNTRKRESESTSPFRVLPGGNPARRVGSFRGYPFAMIFPAGVMRARPSTFRSHWVDGLAVRKRGGAGPRHDPATVQAKADQSRRTGGEPRHGPGETPFRISSLC